MNDLDQSLHSGCYNTQPIGIELHLLIFAFDRSGPLGNSMFIQYTIINKGDGDVQDCYIGSWSDVDNGDANDDLIGFDVTRGMSYCYGGKPIDVSYGDRPPALGWDFFRGPIVDAPGDTATLPDGTLIPDKKILGATSFNKYYNTDGIFSDPNYSAEGAVELYNLLSGVQKNGDPWIDPITGQETTFLNTGDPVTGTGWLSTEEFPPADIRMLTGAGPFTLAVGDTQKIVVGCVIAQGKNRLSSIDKLKFYDSQLQQAYNLNFDVPTPPVAPEVVVTEEDNQVMLTWAKNAEAYEQLGYDFEGYNVYIGDSPGGPWKRVATYDLINGVLVVQDATYDDDSGVIVKLPSSFGEDKGLKYHYTFTKDYNEFSMANGNTYHVAVTSYGFGVDGVPKTLECSKVENINYFHVTPHKPRPGTVVTQEAFETIEAEHYQGIADAVKYDIWIQLVDPQHIETADYEITFNPDSSWTLWKNGVAVDGYENTKEFGIDKTLPETSNLIDEPLDFFLGVEANFDVDPVPTFDPVIITDEGPEDSLINISSFYREGGKDDDQAVNGLFRKGTKSPKLLYSTLQFRFTGEIDSTTKEVISGGQMATFNWGVKTRTGDHPANPEPGSRNAFLVRIPFEVWDMKDLDPNADPVQINFSFIDQEQALADSADSANFVPTWAPRGKPWSFIVSSEYDEEIHSVLQDTMCTWNFWWEPSATWSKGDIIEFHYTQPVPVKGNVDTVYIKGDPVVLVQDKYKFSLKAPETNVVSDAKNRLDIINVFPNPYLAHTLSETGLHQEHVTFINLPETCTIRVFTIAGQLVSTIEHNDPNSTVHIWDLRNDNNLPVASGFYIAHIDIPDVGEKIIKMAIIFRKQRLRNL